MTDTDLKEIVTDLLGREPGWEAPIDLEKVSRMCWVSKIERKPLENPGMVVANNGSYTIILNSREQLRSRQRFTLAHEIAHILLSGGSAEGINEERGDFTKPQEQGNPGLERLCDRLAAELLMPTSMFFQYASPWAIDSIPRLARFFDTSMTSTAIRFAELMPKPCVLAFWRPSRKTGGRLLPTWHVQNKLCGRSRFHGPTFKNITKASVIYEAFRGTDSCEGTMLIPTLTKQGALYQRMGVEALGYGVGDRRRVFSLISPPVINLD